jgi:hypothetical protein
VPPVHGRQVHGIREVEDQVVPELPIPGRAVGHGGGAVPGVGLLGPVGVPMVMPKLKAVLVPDEDPGPRQVLGHVEGEAVIRGLEELALGRLAELGVEVRPGGSVVTPAAP